VRLQRTCDEGGGAPLAVGAADVNGRELMVRVADGLEQRARGVEAELDLRGAREQETQCFAGSRTANGDRRPEG
jgi:hypothetical protein